MSDHPAPSPFANTTAVIRSATAADAVTLAELHVASWRETYGGLIPEELIARYTVPVRAEMWQGVLATSAVSGEAGVFLVERGGVVLGFGSCAAQRDPELRARGYAGEVTAIYVLRIAQKQGVGAALMAEMARWLAQRDFPAFSLWVLRGNATACRFYERLGGTIIGRREDRRGDIVLDEVAYGFCDFRGAQLGGRDAS
jgi:ribosomal protein S18 acetylase RimI-like enzyme